MANNKFPGLWEHYNIRRGECRTNFEKQYQIPESIKNDLLEDYNKIFLTIRKDSSKQTDYFVCAVPFKGGDNSVIAISHKSPITIDDILDESHLKKLMESSKEELANRLKTI